MTKTRKKRPTKRRKKIVSYSWLVPKTTTTMAAFLAGQTVWYPTMPPRKMTWGARVKEIARRMGVL